MFLYYGCCKLSSEWSLSSVVSTRVHQPSLLYAVRATLCKLLLQHNDAATAK
jgi:hypothetical protein